MTCICRLTRNMVSCGDIFWKTTLWIEDLPDLSKKTDSAMTGMGSKRISTKQRAHVSNPYAGVRGAGHRGYRVGERDSFERLGGVYFYAVAVPVIIRMCAAYLFGPMRRILGFTSGSRSSSTYASASTSYSPAPAES